MRRNRTTGRRRWAFRLLTLVAVPVLVLVSVETLLRVLGYGHETSFTVPCRVGETEAYCSNPTFTWQFFPPRIARTPLSLAIPAVKSDDAYRIFVLGGSAAQGDPDHTYGLTRILGTLLVDRFPEVRFEVINTGVTAINSHVVLPIARDLARREGDLFVVYLGNNEVVGPFGPGSAFARLSASLSLIRASVFVRSTRLGQLLAEPVSALGGARAWSEWRGMEMFLEHRIRADDPRMEKVYAHFRSNLEAIVDEAAGSGAGVVVSTVGTDLRDSAPFASLNREDWTEEERGAFERHYREGVEHEARGRLDEALASYLAAEAIDGSFAAVQFRLGRLDAAPSRFVAARDLDALRFRADTRINEIIREVARRRASDAIRLLDAEELLAANGPDGIPGAESFHEHVHLNFHGNYLIASALLETVTEMLPDRLRAARAPRPPLTERQCAERLAYSGFDRHRIATEMLGRLERPPFTNRLDNDRQLERFGERVAGLEPSRMPEAMAATARLYDEALAGAEDDPWLRFNRAVFLGQFGDPSGAEADLREFLARLPQDVPGREKLAAAMAELGRFEEAIAECRRVLEVAPDFPIPHYTLAYSLARLNRFDESLGVYRRLLEIDPISTVQIHNEIARIQIHREEFEAAARSLGRAIQHNEQVDRKRIPDAYYNYGYALKRTGRLAEAREAFRQAANWYREELLTSGESAVLQMAIGRALVESDAAGEAVPHLREATRLDPTSVDAHIALIRTLDAMGRTEEARDAVSRGVRALRTAGLHEQAAGLVERFAGAFTGSGNDVSAPSR